MSEFPLYHNGPVTFIVSRVIKPGRETEFEDWARGITKEAIKFEGHIGVDVIRPNEHMGREYAIILRFSTYQNLRNWMDSDVRKEWLAKVEPLIQGNPRAEVLTGLEYWFTPPGVVKTPPPRYKQAFLTWLGIVPLNLLASVLLHPYLDWMPRVLEVMVTAGLLVLLMTYAVMPMITRLFSNWLYPRHKQV